MIACSVLLSLWRLILEIWFQYAKPYLKNIRKKKSLSVETTTSTPTKKEK